MNYALYHVFGCKKHILPYGLRIKRNLFISILLVVDCWDGPNEEPIVYHGHTLTSKITFQDAVKAISEHAFEYSRLVNYIILFCQLLNQDLEQNCSPRFLIAL